MIKQQKIHDYLIDSGLISADQLSVYTENGLIDWQFNAERQSFELHYQANILVREYSKEPHLLFLCLVTGLAETDPNPDQPHNLRWQSSLLNNKTVDLEFTLNFIEYYEYRDVEAGEPAEAMLGDVPVRLIVEETPPLGEFLRFSLLMDNEHHL